MINIPFGVWRAKSRKFSLQWVLAIHIPVGILILLRLLLDVEFRFDYLPFYIVTFFLGQLLGKKLRNRNTIKYV
jgi:hypothetical protein